MTTILTVEDVKQVIAQARGGKSDPMGVITAVFEGLGESASVTGAVLQQGLTEFGIVVPAEVGAILGGIQSLEKNGDQIKLTLGAQLQPEVKGTPLRLGPTISCTLQKFPDGMALADITGIQVNKFVWIDIQRLQFHDNAGKRSIRVDTNFGGKDFDLP